jgi:translation initiation factor IF-2
MRSKGNLRTGFVQQAPLVPEILDFNDGEFGKKKDDKRRNKSIASESTPTKLPAEGEQVKHFDAAEFRKREMVFQPKKKKGLLNRPSMKTTITTPKASKRLVKVNQTMKVSDLAVEMNMKAPELIKALMKQGVMANMNMDLDFDTIALIVPEFGFEAVNAFESAEEVILKTAFGETEAAPVTRAPVVTIMGHVDHGKTSLLDAIRNANVASGEAGGITQHIGAYQVTTETGHVVTFLDTPGHEAFTAMRARGANVTDIAVIVVAADDGVMPQTAEAISHAKTAGVPMIVAMNKMDKPGANPDRIKQQLTEYEVVPEEWGGTTIFVGVSALKKTGIKELLEQIHLVAEVAELKANPKRSATGAVIESKLEKGRGAVATVLVKDGTLKIGQHIVAGTILGKVRSMTNDRGQKITEAGPGVPVEILGLDGMPSAGDQFDAVLDEKIAQQVVQIRKDQIIKNATPAGKVSLEDIFSKVKTGDVKELNVVLKADVAGSLEAIIGMFSKASTPEVKLKVIHSAVGGVTENDVLLAQTAKGIVVGFNVRPDSNAAATAKRLGVDVRGYTIVYEMMDEIKKAMAGLLTPDVVEKVMGRAEVRNTFNVPKIGTIAGTFVADGKVQRSNLVRLVRDGKIVYDGKISSLKRFKDDAKEVAQGFECGIGIEGYNDLKVGDVIEAYVKEEVARELTQSPSPNA